jgi:hypothetical protein
LGTKRKGTTREALRLDEVAGVLTPPVRLSDAEAESDGGPGVQGGLTDLSLRRTLIVASLACLVLGGAAVVPASAGVVNFAPKTFAAEQQAGDGIVVFVHAPW